MKKERVRWTAIALWALSVGPVFAGGNQMEAVMGQAVRDLKQVVASGLMSAAPAAEAWGEWPEFLFNSALLAKVDAQYVLFLIKEDRKESKICRSIGVLETVLGHTYMFAVGGSSRKQIGGKAFDTAKELGDRAQSLAGYCGDLAIGTEFAPPVKEGDREELKVQVEVIIVRLQKLKRILSAPSRPGGE